MKAKSAWRRTGEIVRATSMKTAASAWRSDWRGRARDLDEDSRRRAPWRRTGEVVRATSIKTAAKSAWSKFNADRRGMLLIPVVAAFVGWFTNWLAVK